MDTDRPITGPPPCFTLNEARALFDGDAYAEMPALLSRARRSIRMTLFLFGGAHADRMIDILAEKRAAGVSVCILLDRTQGMLPLVRRECRAAYRRLRQLGLDVALSAPAGPLPGGGANSAAAATILHSKYLIADDREALVGGMNIGTLFFRHHDVMVHLTGPAAAALGQQFDQEWQSLNSPAAPAPPLETVSLPEEDHAPVPDASSAGPTTQARIVGNGIRRWRTTEQAVLQNLLAARATIDVAMCEMGQTTALAEVIAAHRRGVRVRVLLDPLRMGEYLHPALGRLRHVAAPPGILNASAVEALRKAGVPVHFYRLGPDFCQMHLKMALFDGIRAVVGSTNWTRGGFEWVGETDVEMRGGAVLAQMAAQFEQDWQERSVPAALPPRPVRLLGRLYARLYHR